MAKCYTKRSRRVVSGSVSCRYRTTYRRKIIISNLGLSLRFGVSIFPPSIDSRHRLPPCVSNIYSTILPLLILTSRCIYNGIKVFMLPRKVCVEAPAIPVVVYVVGPLRPCYIRRFWTVPPPHRHYDDMRAICPRQRRRRWSIALTMTSPPPRADVDHSSICTCGGRIKAGPS